jgi:hypothetical protein
MFKKIIYIKVLIALTVVCGFAQTPMPTPTASPTPASLETILIEAEKQTLNYREAFKNLLANETKTFEKYDKNGELKERSVVESNFFVYQSSKDENTSSELRNVIKVDDKPVPDSQARADRFLGELQKTTTIEKELEKIQDEGSRYDKTLEVNGLTLFEAVVLSDHIRPDFDFKLLGTENFQGAEVYAVSYQQKRKNPFITVNEKQTQAKGLKLNYDLDLPRAIRKQDMFLRGKLWIDAKTFQVRREERQLMVQPANPIVALETNFEYQPSEYEIMVPKQISVLENSFKKGSKDNQYNAVRTTKVVFDYSKFRKSEVDVQIIDEP